METVTSALRALYVLIARVCCATCGRRPTSRRIGPFLGPTRRRLRRRLTRAICLRRVPFGSPSACLNFDEIFGAGSEKRFGTTCAIYAHLQSAAAAVDWTQPKPPPLSRDVWLANAAVAAAVVGTAVVAVATPLEVTRNLSVKRAASRPPASVFVSHPSTLLAPPSTCLLRFNYYFLSLLRPPGRNPRQARPPDGEVPPGGSPPAEGRRERARRRRGPTCAVEREEICGRAMSLI
jgi:hypothetical protein